MRFFHSRAAARSSLGCWIRARRPKKVCQHRFDINLTPLMDIAASTHTVIPQTLPSTS